MSDLQWGLLALGVIIILGVVLFNWWQEQKLLAEASERFDQPQSDALMDEFHFDAEAILETEDKVQSKHTPTSTQAFVDTIPLNPAPVDSSSNPSDDQEPAHDVSGHEKIPSYNQISSFDQINEVHAALQEFERDMAEPFQEQQQAADLEGLHEEIETSALFADMATTAELAEEAGMDATPQAQQPASQTSTHISLPADIDQKIDLIAILYLAKPATGSALREFLSSIIDLDKPIYAHGLGFDGMWRLLTPEQEAVEFTRATCSLQLADRSGFVSKISLGRFQHAVDNIGHTLGAHVEWQGSVDPWHFASELDQFCVGVDKMVGFNLVQGLTGPFTGTKFRGLAEASGLTLKNDGVFHYEAGSESMPMVESDQSLFSVINLDDNPFSTEMLRTSVIYGVKFQLDIPRVKNSIEVFNQMVLMARQMENSLNANLIDDNQRPLGETQIEKIRQQLRIIHAKMVTRGIEPGSFTALRLFS